VRADSSGSRFTTVEQKGSWNMVRAHWNGVVIAESDDTVIADGNHYFPADSVDERYLVPSDTTTVCSWKGRASYYSLEVEGQLNRDAAWFYPTPSAAAQEIEGRVAFQNGVQVDDGVPSTSRRSLLDRLRRRPDRGEGTHGDAPTAAVVADLDDASFPSALEHRVTIVDFWAPWCGPCKQLHPMFDARAADHVGSGLQFARVNVDENPVDVVVVGMGPGGEDVAGKLAEAGLAWSASTPELVGGECPYWGCIPRR
jgi:uncharacterized protein (DUF427 family)